MSFYENNSWSVDKIQPIAINKIYHHVWPNCEVIELDNDYKDTLKKILDISGSDKLIKFEDKTVAFLGQRFRRYDNTRDHDDFTLRVWNYVTNDNVEFKKVVTAFDNNRHVSHYYAYGHVNKEENGFTRFRIINFPAFLKQYTDRRLLPDQRIPTNTGDAEFLCWRFSRIPRNLIMFDSTRKKTLEGYFNA